MVDTTGSRPAPVGHRSCTLGAAGGAPAAVWAAIVIGAVAASALAARVAAAQPAPVAPNSGQAGPPAAFAPQGDARSVAGPADADAAWRCALDLVADDALRDAVAALRAFQLDHGTDPRALLARRLELAIAAELFGDRLPYAVGAAEQPSPARRGQGAAPPEASADGRPVDESALARARVAGLATLWGGTAAAAVAYDAFPGNPGPVAASSLAAAATALTLSLVATRGRSVDPGRSSALTASMIGGSAVGLTLVLGTRLGDVCEEHRWYGTRCEASTSRARAAAAGLGVAALLTAGLATLHRPAIDPGDVALVETATFWGAMTAAEIARPIVEHYTGYDYTNRHAASGALVGLLAGAAAAILVARHVDPSADRLRQINLYGSAGVAVGTGIAFWTVDEYYGLPIFGMQALGLVTGIWVTARHPPPRRDRAHTISFAPLLTAATSREHVRGVQLRASW